MTKAKPFETLTLSPVAQKTIELALRLNQTPETLLFAVIASQEGDPLVVVERREGAIRAAGRGAQSTPKALDQEGINRFAQQINDFGESTDVVALGIIHPQSGLAPSTTEVHGVLSLSDGEVDLFDLEAILKIKNMPRMCLEDSSYGTFSESPPPGRQSRTTTATADQYLWPGAG